MLIKGLFWLTAIIEKAGRILSQKITTNIVMSCHTMFEISCLDLNSWIKIVIIFLWSARFKLN